MPRISQGRLDWKQIACKLLTEKKPSVKYHKVDFSPDSHYYYNLFIEKRLFPINCNKTIAAVSDNTVASVIDCTHDAVVGCLQGMDVITNDLQGHQCIKYTLKSSIYSHIKCSSLCFCHLIPGNESQREVCIDMLSSSIIHLPPVIFHEWPHPSSVILYQRQPGFLSLSDFQHSKTAAVDYTGNAGLWPSEELLCRFLITNLSVFRGKRVVEIAAGLGIAGLFLALTGVPSVVFLTDGNPVVVEYLKINVRLNQLLLKKQGTISNSASRTHESGLTDVCVIEQSWTSSPSLIHPSMLHSFDIILGADCTFIDDQHLNLLGFIQLLAAPATPQPILIILFTPQRGNSLNRFVQKARETGWNVDINDNYDPLLTMHHIHLTNPLPLDNNGRDSSNVSVDQDIGDTLHPRPRTGKKHCDYDGNKNYPSFVTLIPPLNAPSL